VDAKRLVAGLEGLRSLHMLVPGTHGLVFDVQGEAYSFPLVCAGLGCGVVWGWRWRCLGVCALVMMSTKQEGGGNSTRVL